MSGIETLMSIVKVEGEVMLHDGRSGWVRAIAGMVFPMTAEITIKTGLSGRADVITARGELVQIPPNALQLILKSFPADDVDTLRQFSITARDMMAARVSYQAAGHSYILTFQRQNARPRGTSVPRFFCPTAPERDGKCTADPGSPCVSLGSHFP